MKFALFVGGPRHGEIHAVRARKLVVLEAIPGPGGLGGTWREVVYDVRKYQVNKRLFRVATCRETGVNEVLDLMLAERSYEIAQDPDYSFLNEGP